VKIKGTDLFVIAIFNENMKIINAITTIKKTSVREAQLKENERARSKIVAAIVTSDRILNLVTSLELFATFLPLSEP